MGRVSWGHDPRYELDYGPRYPPGRRATPRVGPPGHATRRTAGPRYASGRRAAPRFGPRAARRTNYSATAPLDLRTNGRTTQMHTNGHRGPAPLESTAGFMYHTLGLRSGVRLGLLDLESTKHHWTGQLGPRHRTVIRLHLLGPAAILGSRPKPGREEQRGPTQGGAGGRRRLRRAEPGRARPVDVGVMGKLLPSFPIARWEIAPFHIYPFIREV